MTTATIKNHKHFQQSVYVKKEIQRKNNRQQFFSWFGKLIFVGLVFHSKHERIHVMLISVQGSYEMYSNKILRCDGYKMFLYFYISLVS